MPFQTFVNLNLPLAVEGDFASTNPRATVLAGESSLVAGPQGVTTGQFAWVEADGRTVTNYAQGNRPPDGFVHRDQGAALITQYLGEASNLIPAGFPVTLYNAGDFFDKIIGGSASIVGSQVFARFSDGTCFIGSAPTGATATGSIGSTFTATAAGNQLTVSAVTGLISVGDTISGTGVPAGTTILAGPAAGGAGVYTTSAVTTAAAATVTSFGNVLNVTAVGSGVLTLGDAISGTGIPANATIETFVSGALGGVGVYTLNIPATAFAASTAVTVLGGILTKFVAKSIANVGELVKISTWGN
jgi:hypothetical protein